MTSQDYKPKQKNKNTPPSKHPYLVFFLFLLLISDNPSERPYMGLTETILSDLGLVFYRSLGKIAGLNEVKIFPVEIFLFFSVHFINAQKENETTKAAKALLFTVILITIYGVTSGGSLRFAALQLRPLICLIYFSMFVQSIKCTGIIYSIERIIVAACVIRSLFGLYLWVKIFKNLEIYDQSMGAGTYVMSHSDSTLSVAAIIIVTTWWLDNRISPRNFLIATSIIIIFCTLNNRRIFFVELTVSIIIIFILLKAERKLNIKHKFSLAMGSISYLIWGWNTKSTLGYPVQTIKSSIMQSDASSQTRGIENYNLIFTIRKNPIFGQGFGHQYIEKIKAFDISHHFNAYLFVPHNSILWIWSAGGIIFAVFFYNFFTVAAKRENNHAGIELVKISAIATYFIHCFGDMGAQCWKTSVLTGIIIGATKIHGPKNQHI